MNQIYSHSPCVAAIVVCASLASLPAVAQPSAPLCELGIKPAVAKMSLRWDSFNFYGNRKESVVESGYTQSGEGASCKIKSQRADGKSVDRPCTWNPRLSCELELGKAPISHSFNTGAYQRGKLQWVGNEKLAVSVKRGEATVAETRDVAVVKFIGTWSRGSDRGDSISTLYYDREWGLMLKALGAHDANEWGDTVTLVEIAP
jgi:hypothetical protein